MKAGGEEWRELYQEIEETLDEKFSGLRKSVVKNLAHLVIALVVVLRTPRGWYGRLSLSALARGMCTPGKVKSRYKRLNRFLDNPFFDGLSLSRGLGELVLGKEKPAFLPVMVDQTAVRDVQVLAASYASEGRALPLALASFEHSQIKISQNDFEEAFLERLARMLEGWISKVVWIMDRGYARASLLKKCRQSNKLYIIRGRREVIIQYSEEGQMRRINLGRLRHREGIPRRYRNLFYQDTIKEKVDVIVYRGKGFAEPWFLLVPPNCEALLPTELVVEWYRARMNIETSFRDFKSSLGVRGLRLEVRKAERLEHLLAGLAISYLLLLTLGVSSLGRQLRKQMEVLRKHPRHGSRRTLSVLSIALMAATDSFLLSRSNLMKVLAQCLLKLRESRVFEPRLSAAPIVDSFPLPRLAPVKVLV